MSAGSVVKALLSLSQKGLSSEAFLQPRIGVMSPLICKSCVRLCDGRAAAVTGATPTIKKATQADTGLLSAFPRLCMSTPVVSNPRVLIGPPGIFQFLCQSPSAFRNTLTTTLRAATTSLAHKHTMILIFAMRLA